MRRAALAAVALAAVAATPAVPQIPTGRIVGHVRLTARAPGLPLPSSPYVTRSVNRHDGPATPELRNVVVSLKEAAFRGTLPSTNAELRQVHETFVPHTLAVTRGSSVAFPNDDPFFHNVFSLSSAATFNLGRYPRGETRRVTFDAPGVVKVFCDIHSQMSATIMVFDHPYFAIPSDDGAYEIAGVPPGAYTLVGWHERIGDRAVPVRVEAGSATTVDLTVPVEDLR
jgi:plastocyanin